jgi:hypothetical protein
VFLLCGRRPIAKAPLKALFLLLVEMFCHFSHFFFL